MKEYFLKMYVNDIRMADEENLTTRQKLNSEVYASGAIRLYLILYKNIVRHTWKDAKGYPLKKQYYSKNMLVCSMSKPTLQKKAGVGLRKINKWIDLLKEAGWMVVSNNVKDHQNVFVLGTWEGEGAEYKENLGKDLELRERQVMLQAESPEDTDEDFEARFQKYCDEVLMFL